MVRSTVQCPKRVLALEVGSEAVPFDSCEGAGARASGEPSTLTLHAAWRGRAASRRRARPHRPLRAAQRPS